MESQGCAQELNRFLVEVFNGVLKTEETYVARSCPDLSLREVHVIEAVCRAVDRGEDNRPSAIASLQRVTAGTLTAAVNQLEAKGCLERVRDRGDKRSVRLRPTERGREADRRHAAFHREMVEEIARALPPEELAVLVRGLRSLSAFFRERYLGEQG